MADPGGALPVLAVDLGPGVRAGFTTRAGGVSGAPWTSLNLGLAVGDDPDRVRANRARVSAWAGAPVAFATQVHGRDVLDAGPLGAAAPPDTLGEADALVALDPGSGVAVLVADCVPVLLADAAAGVVAAVHVGRRGLVADVLAAAVGRMVARGADPDRMRAAVGPAIAGRSYEVPAALRDEVADAAPGTATTTAWGTPALDLPAGVLRRLVDLGVARVVHRGDDTFTDAVRRLVDLGVARVVHRGDDTFTDAALFSHRRSAGRTGRSAGVVRPPR